MKGVTKCSKCGYTTKDKREVCKIGNKQICKKCLKERRLKKRKQIEKTIEPTIEPKIIKIKETTKPKSLTKQTKKKLRILYINKNEIDVLFKKLKNNGFNSKEIKERIKVLKLQMEIVKEKIKGKNLPEEETNKMFLEEYNKLIEKATR